MLHEKSHFSNLQSARIATICSSLAPPQWNPVLPFCTMYCAIHVKSAGSILTANSAAMASTAASKLCWSSANAV